MKLEVRPWRRGDDGLLIDAAARLSPLTLRRRFWVGTPWLPPSYLQAVADRWPRCWDAVVALDEGGLLVGWAEYGRYADDPDRADVAVCVVDAEQGHGLGTRLLGEIVAVARASGVVSLHADIEAGNEPARHAWRAATGGTLRTYALAG